jgi:hypothetical protein
MMTAVEKHGYLCGYLTKSAGVSPALIGKLTNNTFTKTPAKKPVVAKTLPPPPAKKAAPKVEPPKDPDAVNDKNDIFESTGSRPGKLSIGIRPGKSGYPDASIQALPEKT